MVSIASKTDYKFHLLIIDDEPDFCEMLYSMLYDTPYFEKIIIAHNSIEALQKMSNQFFDLIILDNKMPKRDGTEIIEQIIQKDFKKKSKIIFMSGNLTAVHFMIATELGVRHFIIKPFTRKKLVDLVKKALSIQEVI